MKTKMKRILILALTSTLFSISALAATPTISSVSGTVSTGQTLTITGANLVNETATNANWDTAFQGNSKMYGFESAVSSGTALQMYPGNDNWYLCNNSPPGSQPSGAINNDCRFAASPKLAGSLSMSCRVYGGKSMQTNDGGSGFSAYPGSTSGNFYFRYYARYHTNNGNYPDVYTKMTVTQPSGSGNMWYLDWAGASAGQTPSELTTKYGAVSGPEPALKLQNDRWYCFEGAWLSPGTYKLWVDGKLLVDTSPGVSMPDNAYPQWGIINFRSNSVYADFNEWLDNLAFGHTSRIYPSSVIEISGDNQLTWKWQPPISLSDTSIAVTSELPALTAANYLLRVTNNAQQISAVYTLSGGGGGGDTQAPSVPAGLAASVISSSQINLSWSASTDNVGVTGYKIYRGGTLLTTTTSRTYNNTGLAASTAYSYRVSAIDAAGNESSQCTAVSATTQAAQVTDTTKPSVPAGLSASVISSSQINLSWSASTDNVGVTGYKIYRGGILLTTTTSRTYNNTGLTASTAYSYRVSAIDAAGNESSQCTAVSATTQAAQTTDTTKPSVPAGLAASVISSSQINLSWSASTDNVGVTGYKIYRGGTLLTTTTSRTHNDTGLSASTAYSYRVSAIDAAGNESSQCTAVSATTQAGSSTGVILFQESFSDNSFASRNWYDNTAHGTVVSGGQSGNCLQWAWSQGGTTATNGGSMRMKFTATDSLYVSFYVKFQSGWRGSQKSYHPHMILIPSNLDSEYTPLANNYLNTYIEFVSDVGSPYTIRPLIAIQDEKRVNTSNGTPPNNLTAITENRSVAYCNTPVSSGASGTCYADNPYYSANTWKASSASVSTNVWHHVEVYFKMNTISGGKGLSNGIMQKWVDGTLVLNKSDVLYRTNQDATKKWAQFVFAPYIGDGSPIAQSMWIDELTVGTALPSSGTLQAPTGFSIKEP